MERFYIITNLMKDPDYGITKEIQKYIEQHGRECILAKEDEQGFIFPRNCAGKCGLRDRAGR